MVLAIVLGMYAKHQRWLVVLPVVVILVVITFLKGTSPGGPSAREEFDAQQGDRYQG